MTEAASEWLALDVKDIDEKKLLPGVIGKDGMQPHLPTQIVRIPFENPDQVAVVSWRWDGDLQTKGSRNIASVINVAKQRGIRYIFIDIISIDQNLPAKDLIKQVAAFSALYTNITVLVAYDTEGKHVFDLTYTIFRPWITNEMRLFRQNPGRIIYAGHSKQGSHHLHFNHETKLPNISNKDSTKGVSNFVSMLDTVWRASFVISIVGVLSGDIGISFISDFKYIIPAYSHIISVAHNHLDRNDFLLTIAILCCNVKATYPLVMCRAFDKGIQTLRYSRYIITEARDKPNESWAYYEITLDGTLVAQWRHKRPHTTYSSYGYFITMRGHERTIFASLGLADSDYEEFLATEEARLACLLVDNREEIPVPTVETVEVDLLSE